MSLILSHLFITVLLVIIISNLLVIYLLLRINIFVQKLKFFM